MTHFVREGSYPLLRNFAWAGAAQGIAVIHVTRRGVAGASAVVELWPPVISDESGGGTVMR